MLTTLPLEVFSIITDELTKPDLESLSLVSRRTRELTTRALWQSVTLRLVSDHKLHCVRPARVPHECYEFTTEFHLRSDFVELLTKRCPHVYYDPPRPNDIEPSDTDSEDDDESIGLPCFDRLGERLESVLRRFRDGQLRSFSWDLAVCVPSAILGSRGIVSLRQSSRLRSLYLKTNPTCYEGRGDDCEIDLSPFRQLRSLTWKAPTARNLETLSVALRSNATHLQEFDLDLADWGSLKERLKIGNDQANSYFSKTVLGLDGRFTAPYFQDIRILSLSRVAITASMVPLINFSTLVSLTLRQCPGWVEFLHRIGRQKYSIRLKRLEIQGLLSDHPTTGQEVGLFIRTFKGLEELFVSELATAPYNQRLWDYASLHRATLKKFVYHLRARDRTRGFALFDNLKDSKDLAILPNRMRDIMKNPARRGPFAKLSVECIGLSCALEQLKTILQPFRSKRSLKLLHIRQSRRDMHCCGSIALETRVLKGIGMFGSKSDSEELEQREVWRGLQREFRCFLEWAYGPTGLPSLQVIAFGDFSINDPWSKCNVIVCKDKDKRTKCRVLNPSEPKAKRIFSEFRNVLEACPVEPILDG